MAGWPIERHNNAMPYADLPGVRLWYTDSGGSGRPVVLQDTGFAAAIPVGQGIVPFTAADEAAAAIGEIEGDYARHARAARAIAGEYFGSDAVLSRLIRDVLSGNRRTLPGQQNRTD